jgi:hypothetical protein
MRYHQSAPVELGFERQIMRSAAIRSAAIRILAYRLWSTNRLQRHGGRIQL